MTATNKEVAQAFASGNRYKLRSHTGNLYFEGPTAYSYGSHWPLAHKTAGQWLRRQIVLVNSNRRSVTTSQHAGVISAQLAYESRYFQVPVPDPLANTAERHAKNAEALRKAYYDAVEAYRRTRKYKGMRAADVVKAKEEHEAYLALVFPGPVPEGFELLPLTVPEEISREARLYHDRCLGSRMGRQFARMGY